MVKFQTRRNRGLLATAANIAAAAMSKIGTRSNRITYTKTAMKMRKYAQSKLRTAQRRKNPMIRRKAYSNVGGQGTFSTFSLTNRASPRVRTMKKVGAPCYDLINNSQQLVVSEGFQGNQTFYFNDIGSLRRYDSHVPVDYDPAHTLPSLQNKRFLLESTTGEYLISNSSLATAYVDIYDIVRKRDATGLTGPTSSPSAAWSAGVSNESGAITPNPIGDLHILPTDSMLFKDYFKVKKRTHIALAQGATHRHSLKLKVNKLIDEELIGNASGDLAGFTVYTMIVAYGQPASVPASEPSTGPNPVTTAKVALDVVYSSRTKFTWVQDNTTNLWVNDNLVSLPNEVVVSAGSGTFLTNIAQ